MKKKEELVQILKETIGKNDVLFCDGEMDALVLFDFKELPSTNAAPVFGEIVRTQHVHLFGFAPLNPFKTFSVFGEVHSIQDGNILITCLSVPGLSGGAVVCDGTGGVIAYSAGAMTGSDKSTFGAYAFKLELLLAKLKTYKQATTSSTQETKNKRRRRKKQKTVRQKLQ